MGLRRFIQASYFQCARTSGILKHVRYKPPSLVQWRHSGSSLYKAVIFDMGGVLLPSPYRMAVEWEVRNRIPRGTIKQALISGGENRPWLRYMRGELTSVEFLHEFGQQCSEIANFSVPVDSFLSDLTSSQMSKQLPIMTEALKCIRAEGLKTAVLSNNFYLHSGVSFLPLDRNQFDVVIESCREGICKPDPRIYTLCLERLGVQPKESIFLDDIGQNLKAAAQLGINTVKVDDPEAALKELETYLGFPLRGFVPQTRLVRPTMEIPKGPLQKYLEEVLGGQTTGPLILRQFSHGQSNPTYYIKLGDRNLVLRKKPPGSLLPSAHAVEREYRVLKALAEAGVPVPKVLSLCEDSSVIGTPFYLMEYCTGHIYKDPSLPGLDPGQRRATYMAMNKVLCKIHRVDLKAAGLEDYGKHGLKDCDVMQLGIPTAEEYFQMYCGHMGIPPIENWNFYMAFSFFRVAAILQGVYKRSLTGQASSAAAESGGKQAELMANLAWDFATKEGFRVFKECPAAKPLARPYSTWTRNGAFSRRNYVTMAPSTPAHTSKAHLILSPDGLPGRAQDLYHKLRRFMDSYVYPAEQVLRDHQVSQSRWTPHPLIEELKDKAKSEGLWNLFLPVENDPEVKYGAGLTNQEFAHLCELMGTSLFAPEIFNCSAPDTGNMEVLVRYGTEEQKERWLQPLLDGKIRSCFAMTEPQVASSDATNIESSVIEEKGFYILNGHKWWISGALDPRCQLCVFMGKTDPEAQRHKQQSMLLVPMDTPGITVTRPLSVFGEEDPPAGHGEIFFENVRVPKEYILLGPGRGFEIAQGRLGPGRIHHCMRLMGYSERALVLMKERVTSRVAFGKPLAEQGTILEDIAKSRAEIEQARLLVLKTALLMDTAGNKAAALEIAMIKMVAPLMALRVIDRAIQAFGAAGLSNDYPLAQFFAWARALRLADGPDEVHRTAVAKLELKR
ncbi:acyl-CoA dehydrogenase family member 10 isoform X2 [Caretta caretta]|uniref:acyl-CoA dehydrogenase family member 10 isoform X2 n=1 Tax=Caretta caretta TaxID=8467 RepID=UPI003F4B67A9